jgi:ATP-dependent 26S proteasome regulatory subunit
MTSISKPTSEVAVSDQLTRESWPTWAKQLADLYFSGTTSQFVLHGNTFDLVPLDDAATGSSRHGTLADFLSEQIFGRWDLVLHYDLARGLRCMGGRDGSRLKEMVLLANKRGLDLSQLARDPTTVLHAIDRFILRMLTVEPKDRLKVAVIIDHASYVAPAGDRAGLPAQTNVVTLINWAQSPFVKRENLAFVLIDSRQSDVSDRLTSNPHVATIEVPLPDEAARLRFLKYACGDRELSSFSDFELPQLATLTAGISLADLSVIVQPPTAAGDAGARLDRKRLGALKKRLIERQAQGLIEFIEPRWTFEVLVGHEAAKQRLVADGELLRRGALASVPMGYLVCGPVGTGKSFFAHCTAGTIGIPCVELKNFRSKYVGETEGNLQRVLGVLRAMGPVAVIVDEADAMLGDREQSGDSGTSSRVFGMIAAQMGDTRYRGRILWMLLTTRPDLLPIDLKRQGRAEVHIPLFYPSEPAELAAMFVAMAKKMGATLDAADVPPTRHIGQLSGADVEGIVGRAWREALLADRNHIDRTTLERALAGFLPSTQTLERELQELAAILECTDLEFLPHPQRSRLEAPNGREQLQQRFNDIKRSLRG